MITVSLRSPAAWRSSIDGATATWPPAIMLVSDADGTEPTIRAAALDFSAPPPWSAGSAVSRGRARATVVGRSPMAPHRVTAWIRRTALRTATDGDHAELEAWETEETIHEFEIPSDVHAPGTGRNLVRSVAADFPRIDDVLLALSELTANALNHGGGPRRIAAAVSREAIAIEITDAAPGTLPIVLPLGGIGISGRGMAIVNAIADHWGVTTQSATKTVWCEFSRSA
jgi:anti-sigma regulatory factor (Ser/Thr protein kinase)